MTRQTGRTDRNDTAEKRGSADRTGRNNKTDKRARAERARMDRQ